MGRGVLPALGRRENQIIYGDSPNDQHHEAAGSLYNRHKDSSTASRIFFPVAGCISCSHWSWEAHTVRHPFQATRLSSWKSPQRENEWFGNFTAPGTVRGVGMDLPNASCIFFTLTKMSSKSNVLNKEIADGTQ